jgi:hypothetical protein
VKVLFLVVVVDCAVAVSAGYHSSVAGTTICYFVSAIAFSTSPFKLAIVADGFVCNFPQVAAKKDMSVRAVAQASLWLSLHILCLALSYKVPGSFKAITPIVLEPKRVSVR